MVLIPLSYDDIPEVLIHRRGIAAVHPFDQLKKPEEKQEADTNRLPKKQFFQQNYGQFLGKPRQKRLKLREGLFVKSNLVTIPGGYRRTEFGVPPGNFKKQRYVKLIFQNNHPCFRLYKFR